jgi:hypothetical protein
MLRLLAISTGSGDLAIQTARPWEWLFVVAALLAAGALVLVAMWAGGGRGWRAVTSGISRIVGLPAWASSAFTIGLWSLTVALIGFQWDVAWHIDNGRDRQLFTVPHTLIVLGIGGVLAAGIAAIALATLHPAGAALRVRRLRIPRSALALSLLGVAAALGFPLDDRWHATYGIDVTMWSPTHLLMIGAAGLATIALWLLMAEGRAAGGSVPRWRWMAFGGVALVGLSALQLEYDQGVPQWQLVFQPLLIAVAAGVALVAARVAAGPGAALASAVAFLVIRGAMLLLVGIGFGYTPPLFALYLPEAIAVELAFLLLGGRARPALIAVVAGLLIGTAGLGGEALWVKAFFVYAWGPALLPYAWQFIVGAVAAALVGLGLGEALAGRPASLPAMVPIASIAVIGGLLAFHVFARHAEPAEVTVMASPSGPVQAMKDREGDLNPGGPEDVSVIVSPRSSVAGADFFEVVAWQGHGRTVHRRLVETGPGRYRAEGPIPTGGDWKSIVIVCRGDVLEAVPVAMPADRAYSLAPIAAPTEPRTAQFVTANRLLMREFHGGVSPIGVIATALFIGFVVSWLISLHLCVAGLSTAAERVRPRLPAGRRPVLG